MNRIRMLEDGIETLSRRMDSLVRSDAEKLTPELEAKIRAALGKYRIEFDNWKYQLKDYEKTARKMKGKPEEATYWEVARRAGVQARKISDDHYALMERARKYGLTGYSRLKL